MCQGFEIGPTLLTIQAMRLEPFISVKHVHVKHTNIRAFEFDGGNLSRGIEIMIMGKISQSLQHITFLEKLVKRHLLEVTVMKATRYFSKHTHLRVCAVTNAGRSPAPTDDSSKLLLQTIVHCVCAATSGPKLVAMMLKAFKLRVPGTKHIPCKSPTIL
jgi:hypothetical protein